MLCSSCGTGLTGVLAKGDVIGGRYEVFAPLGRGGMGIVYRAHDRVLDEPVAMKVLRSDFEDSLDLTQRFRAEIKLARKVSHRNVCRIHEYGEDGQVHYICMELVTGTDLRTLLKDRRMPLAEAFDAAIQVGLGLEAIHEMGVIHRDLKPSNIMKDARGVVRLMDFGIAKQWGAGTAAGVTLAGQIIGTPEYMSPEQARGEKIDLRSDIYALGIVLFEIFTGHVPFHAPTPLATIFQQLQSPPPLSGPEAEGIPAALIPVLHTALAKDPGQRHQNVGELIAALRQTRAVTLGEVDPTTPPGPIPRTVDVAPVPYTPTVPGVRSYPTPTPVPSDPPTLVADPPAPVRGGARKESGPPTPPTAMQPPVRPPRPRYEPPPTPTPTPAPRPQPGGGKQVLLWTVPAVILVLVGGGLLLNSQLRTDPSPSPSPSPSADGSSLRGDGKVGNVTPPPRSPTPPPRSPEPSPEPTPSPSRSAPPSPSPQPSPSPTRRPEPSPSPVRESPTPLAAKGLLQIVARPWAYVKVDGQDMGTTPLKKFSLSAGAHTVTLNHPSFRPLQRQVIIPPGDTYLLEIDFKQVGVPLTP